MENYIKNNINDITYLSELTQPFWVVNLSVYRTKRAGLNSHSNLCSLRSISCVLI